MCSAVGLTGLTGHEPRARGVVRFRISSDDTVVEWWPITGRWFRRLRPDPAQSFGRLIVAEPPTARAPCPPAAARRRAMNRETAVTEQSIHRCCNSIIDTVLSVFQQTLICHSMTPIARQHQRSRGSDSSSSSIGSIGCGGSCSCLSFWLNISTESAIQQATIWNMIHQSR